MALATGWLRRLQQEWVIPAITPERCVHSRCEVAECTRCVDACPRDAWVLSDDSLQIDMERCDGCGLCVAACTESALEQALLPALRTHEGRATLLFACETLGEGYAGEGVVPCLHAITASQLLEHYRDGYRQVLSCRGECGNCPRHRGGDPFREEMARLNRLLASRGAALVRHAELTPVLWELRRKSPSVPLLQREKEEISPVGRRQFFQRAITFVVEKGMEQAGVGTAETPSLPWPATLPAADTEAQGGLLYPFVPEMDAVRCNGCDACVQLCPHQALQLDKADTGRALAYQIQANHCTGCGVCEDACDQNAIKIRPMALVGNGQMALRQARCKACGCQFHYPDTDNRPQHYCRICAQTNHHRQLFQVYS